MLIKKPISYSFVKQVILIFAFTKGRNWVMEASLLSGEICNPRDTNYEFAIHVFAY